MHCKDGNISKSGKNQEFLPKMSDFSSLRERSLSIAYTGAEGIWVGHEIFSPLLGRV